MSTSVAELLTLAECPIGLFRCNGELCLKTEYGNNEGRIDAYIVSSGEFFWGGTSTPAEQRKVMVQPVPLDRLEALASHEPALGDNQADLSVTGEAQVFDAYYWSQRGMIGPAPLSEGQTNAWVKLSDAQSALIACQQEVETLREGIKEIAERERGIRDNWARFEAETGARNAELETDLEIERDKLHRLTDALTPSAETRADYMGEFWALMHIGGEDHRRVMIPWPSIKDIMEAIRARAVLGGQSNE